MPFVHGLDPGCFDPLVRDFSLKKKRYLFGKCLTSKKEWKAGDIVGFSGRDWLSAGINLATYGIPFWGLSHVGIIGKYYDKLLLFESTLSSSLECVIQEKKVRGVQAHLIDDCIQAYNGRVWRYPLRHELRLSQSRKLTKFLLRYIGTDYDAIGAFRSAGKGFSWIESRLREEDLSSIFCSEYCAGAHRKIELLSTDNVSRWNPNFFVRTERKYNILMTPVRRK